MTKAPPPDLPLVVTDVTDILFQSPPASVVVLFSIIPRSGQHKLGLGTNVGNVGHIGSVGTNIGPTLPTEGGGAFVDALNNVET
jgi:hypothetical protein